MFLLSRSIFVERAYEIVDIDPARVPKELRDFVCNDSRTDSGVLFDEHAMIVNDLRVPDVHGFC